MNKQYLVFSISFINKYLCYKYISIQSYTISRQFNKLNITQAKKTDSFYSTTHIRTFESYICFFCQLLVFFLGGGTKETATELQDVVPHVPSVE